MSSHWDDDLLVRSGRWHDIFFLLSLEGSASFLSTLGLTDISPHDVQSPARSFVTSAIAGHDRQKASEQAIEAIVRSADESTAERVRTLGETLVAAPTNEHQWAMLFWLLAYGEGQGFRVVSLELPEEPLGFVISTIRRCIPKSDALEDVRDAVESVDRSTEPPELQTMSLYLPEALADLITIVRFRRAWASLVPRLSEAHLRQLQSWARQQSQEPEWIFGKVESLPGRGHA